MGVQYPTWFGPDDLPLLGTVHVPDSGRARAAVVLCLNPPIGRYLLRLGWWPVTISQNGWNRHYSGRLTEG